jgi:transcriptional regulator with XRE-family HTH domain
MARKVKEPVAAVKASAMSKFANQLRGWRARRGWSQAEFANELGYSNALVSQIEQGHKPPSAEFAAKCDLVFDTPATFVDLQELVAREAWPSYFAPVIDSETRATQVHEWEQRVTPGLLQTEDYARSVIRAGQPRISLDELERKVVSRMERQAIFARESGRPMYWVVIHEGVLRHVVGSPQIMRAQLDRLTEAADSPDILIQVLPYSASDHPGADGPILVFDFADAPSSGYTECNGGGMIIEQPERVTALVTRINLIRAAALSPRESRQYITKIRDEIT